MTAPGPDGYTAEFFKQNCEIVGKEVTQPVKFCFDKSFMYFPVNSTVLTLVPKTEGVKSMKDYRPIACCNLLYKCYSYILTRRLKVVIPELISTRQNAFVKGR